jgi:5-dehydro-2-deoxygluconokinase
MSLEASGKDWFEFAYGDDWQQHGGLFGVDHAKVLIRDNPGLDADKRLEQAKKLAEVSTWATENHKHLIIELLVPATDADLASVGGDKARYDNELRPKLTLDSIGYLQDNGADPALWKVEGMNAPADAAAVADIAKRGGRSADCIVLGRHASREDLDHWLEVAAPIAGYVGFAIGRSIWWDPLSDLLAGSIPRAVAQSRIEQNYLDYAHAWMAARSAG